MAYKLIEESTFLKPMDPNRLLDFLMQRFGLHSERALAKQLGFAPKVLAGLRARSIPVAPWMLGWIAEASGISVLQIRELLGDRRAKARPSVMLGMAVRGTDER